MVDFSKTEIPIGLGPDEAAKFILDLVGSVVLCWDDGEYDEQELLRKISEVIEKSSAGA